MTVPSILTSDLARARRDRDPELASLLRTLITAIENAQAVEPTANSDATEVPRRLLSPDEIVGILEAERSDLEDAAADFERRGNPPEAARLRARSDVVEHYEHLLAEQF